MKVKRRMLLAGSAWIILGGVASAMAAKKAMIVHRDPNCGCCHLWAKAMQGAGFEVTLNEIDDITPIKVRLGVPADLSGCHTAEVGGYFLEGHVPLSSVFRLLDERPAVKGIAVAGMPPGSLGMGNDPKASYDVIAVASSGETYLFESVRPRG